MTPRTWFRVIATAEAFSWAGLLIGMLFKYALTENEVGVKVFGPIHGAIFMVYVLTVLALFRRFGWDGKVTLLALAASIPPFGTLAFEIWADRTGRLPAAGPEPVTAPVG